MSFDTSTKSFFLYTDKPFFLVVDFGDNTQFVYPGFSFNQAPHPTNPDLTYFVSPLGSTLCVNWRLNTNTNLLFPATSRKSFMDAVCDLINNA